MLLGTIERYRIEQQSDGIHIAMRQAANSIGFLAIALSALCASWWFGPYGPHPAIRPPHFYWMLTTVLSIFCLLGFLGIGYREDWLLRDGQLHYRTTFDRAERVVPIPQALPLRLRVMASSSSQGHPLPFELHVLDPQAQVTDLSFQFQYAKSVDAFIHLLRPVIAIQFDDPRSAHGPV